MSYTVGKYETKKCVKWEVRYRTPGGRTTRKRGFLRKMDAEAWAAENVEIAKAKGTFITQSAGNTPVAELWQSWIETKRTRCKPSYMESLGARGISMWGRNGVRARSGRYATTKCRNG